MGKEQANERLYYYYEFLFKVLKEGVTPLELLDDIEATAWEIAYQTLGKSSIYTLYNEYTLDFSALYENTYQELKQIKEALE